MGNHQQIVGVADTIDQSGASVQQAFLLDSPNGPVRIIGTLWPSTPNQPLAPPYLGNSEANSINTQGVVVGVADTPQVDANGERIRHGFLWDPTIHHPEDLNDPPLPSGWTITEATGINNQTDICGTGVDGSGTERALLLFV